MNRLWETLFFRRPGFSTRWSNSQRLFTRNAVDHRLPWLSLCKRSQERSSKWQVPLAYSRHIDTLCLWWGICVLWRGNPAFSALCRLPLCVSYSLCPLAALQTDWRPQLKQVESWMKLCCFVRSNTCNLIFQICIANDSEQYSYMLVLPLPLMHMLQHQHIFTQFSWHVGHVG